MDLVTVFECSIITDSISKVIGLSAISSSFVITFDYSIGFNKLESVLGGLISTDFMLPLFHVLWICLSLKHISLYAVKKKSYKKSKQSIIYIL